MKTLSQIEERYRENQCAADSKHVSGQSKEHGQHFLLEQTTLLKGLRLLKYVFTGKTLEWVVCASFLYKPVEKHLIFFSKEISIKATVCFQIKPSTSLSGFCRVSVLPSFCSTLLATAWDLNSLF